MRHLINTYIQADHAVDLGNLSSMSLTELIIETGIHDAIAKQLNQKGKLSKNAIAEGIINNVRKTIIRDQLTDPKFYEEISKLLEDLIKQKRDDAESYEKFLKQAEELVKKMAGKTPSTGVPVELHGRPEATVIFNNLPSILADPMSSILQEEGPDVIQKHAALALEIDMTMREKAPAGWKEDIDGPRGKQVINALYPLMAKNKAATQALFDIIKNQPGY
jgi:type I restriction enzyme R subunit